MTLLGFRAMMTLSPCNNTVFITQCNTSHIFLMSYFTVSIPINWIGRRSSKKSISLDSCDKRSKSRKHLLWKRPKLSSFETDVAFVFDCGISLGVCCGRQRSRLCSSSSSEGCRYIEGTVSVQLNLSLGTLPIRGIILKNLNCRFSMLWNKIVMVRTGPSWHTFYLPQCWHTFCVMWCVLCAVEDVLRPNKMIPLFPVSRRS